MSCALQMLSLSVRVSLKRTDKSKIVFVVSELNFLGIVKKRFIDVAIFSAMGNPTH